MSKPIAEGGGISVRTIGELKAAIQRVEAAGGTDATEVWASGFVTFKGDKADLRDTIQVGGTDVVVNEHWAPNFGPLIIFFNAVYDIPDPDDGFPYV